MWLNDARIAGSHATTVTLMPNLWDCRTSLRAADSSGARHPPRSGVARVYGQYGRYAEESGGRIWQAIVACWSQSRAISYRSSAKASARRASTLLNGAMRVLSESPNIDCSG